MVEQPFNKIVEASYLTAEKAWSYRAILRYFYIQHERMREFLFPEEIYAQLKEHHEFQDYTEEQLHQDLAQLVQWNNLVARQETGRAKTIEEFKKKRFRYQCTPYTVEFERMLMQMEKGGDQFGGSLEKKEFERLYQSLTQIESIVSKNVLPQADECSQVWNDTFSYFRSIVKNTSDYIAHINSEEAEERMQTEAFFVFKDQFTVYLRDFIIGLQQTALKIQQILRTLDISLLQTLIHQVVAHQQQVPRFEDVGLTEKELIDEQYEKWATLKTWFLGNEFRISELDSLQEKTNEQIRRITRVVQRLGERHQYFRSRKKDYLHLANWFHSMENMEEAHRLSAVAFGVIHTRHLFSDHVPTDNIYTDVWEEKPVIHITKPRIRNYREKTRPGAMISQTAKKEATRKAYLREKLAEQKALEKYIKGNEIRMKDLPTIEPYVRKMLLGWVGKAMAKKNHIIQTEHGRTIRVVISEEERIILQAKDGVMEMPAITFYFLDKAHG